MSDTNGRTNLGSKRLQPIGALMIAIIMLTGCWVKSLHPFYNENDVVFRPELLGTWLDSAEPTEDTEGSWKFTRAGPNGYLLEIETDDDDCCAYDVRLFELENRLFMDLFTRERNLSAIAAHHLILIDQLKPTLKLRMIDPDFINEFLQSNPDDLDHIRVVDPNNEDRHEIVLTGSTEQIQAFIARNLHHAEFFGDAEELHPDRRVIPDALNARFHRSETNDK